MAHATVAKEESRRSKVGESKSQVALARGAGRRPCREEAREAGCVRHEVAGCHPRPSTLDPRPSSLVPRPSSRLFRSPRASQSEAATVSRHARRSTLDPPSSSLDTRPSTLDPPSSTLDPRHSPRLFRSFRASQSEAATVSRRPSGCPPGRLPRAIPGAGAPHFSFSAFQLFSFSAFPSSLPPWVAARIPPHPSATGRETGSPRRGDRRR